jgi:hypothetical protein
MNDIDQKSYRDLMEAATKGDVFLMFMRHEVGKFLVECWENELSVLIDELIEGKGNDIIIRNKISLLRDVKSYIADVIIRGAEAKQALGVKQDEQ